MTDSRPANSKVLGFQMSSRELFAALLLAAAIAPGCATAPTFVHREAVEIVVWAALAAIEEPVPTPVTPPELDNNPNPQMPAPKPAAQCTTGTCRSVIVR